jgi:hypothetical protein
METNVKFTGIEWWTFKLQQAKDMKIKHKIKHAETQLNLALYLQKYNTNDYRKIEVDPKFIYSLKINYDVKL